MEEAEQDRKYRDYTAITQNSIARLLAAYLGADYSLPNYAEFMYPELTQKADTRTAQEIAQNIADRLLAGAEA